MLLYFTGKSRSSAAIIEEQKNTYEYYAQARFIVIPVVKRIYDKSLVLAGLTTFVDASILGKPVLLSDNTNIGVDVEKLGIEMTYIAGDYLDMARKMSMLLSLSSDEYNCMCFNMKRFVKNHNCQTFC